MQAVSNFFSIARRACQSRRRMTIYRAELYFQYFFILWLLANVSSLDPRMIFTKEELTLKSVMLPEGVHTLLFPERDYNKIMAVGKRHLIPLNFHSPSKAPVERNLLWAECIKNEASANNCNYEVMLAHEREDASRVFLCGTDGAETLCCDTPSEKPPVCTLADDLKRIQKSIRGFVLKDAEHSALVESAEGSSLYVTYSGSQEFVGVHKFGKNRVGPANHDKAVVLPVEQHYLGLVMSKRKDEPLQDKVYAFYKERNKDLNVWSSTWLPYISQFCLADMGGPKNNLQFTWTSQMSARLSCGDPMSKRQFYEMVDIATVHAERWQDTRVYALFRNEWDMSAVCVYAMQDIQDVFSNSPFKGSDHQRGRSRQCVADSTRLSMDILKMTQMNSEMEKLVKPLKNSGPLLISHHVYTHILTDTDSAKEHTLLFLTRKCGGVDKLAVNNSTAFIIAEYRPFSQRAHIDSITLHPSSKQLYISSHRQIVQMDVADCNHYGDMCEECVLARDPYCGWDSTGCTATTTTSGKVVQDVNSGNYHLCRSSLHPHFSKVIDRSSMPEMPVTLSHGSQYVLRCPMGSHHAQYSWHHEDGGVTPCSWSSYGCLLLIDKEQEGAYTCVSEERGFSRVLARYAVKGSATSARPSIGLLFWFCALTALIQIIT
ncbi:semaphorin-7A isoform X2 [Syngnathus scovelli]|uniref:semaphorin-7A isoform X2 n=1 Tax=Syngnathus scovelli TaxID=161590 RepID=UPI0021105690|nr:semaphorin-7A isoform X2 [Syngnathus scovelli]